MGPGIDRRVFSLPGPHSPTSVRDIGVRETCVGAYSEITNNQVPADFAHHVPALPHHGHRTQSQSHSLKQRSTDTRISEPSYF